MTFTGLADLERDLRELSQREALKAVKTGVRAGGRVVARQAKKNVIANPSVDSSLLANRITAKANKGPVSGGQAAAWVGVRGGKQQVVRKGKKKGMLANASKYAHLVELGTEHSAAEPFLRPALDQKGDEAVAKVEESISKSLAKLRL